MRKRLYLFLNLDFSLAATVAGYIFGLIIPVFSGNARLIFDTQKISSAFISDGGFERFLYTACAQAVYPLLIFLLGFIPCASLLCSAILFLRAALASYSSLAISFSGASNYLYLLHSFCSISAIAVCWALSRCARSYQGRGPRKGFLLYTLEFFFFVGVLFIIVFCRHIALAFI